MIMDISWLVSWSETIPDPKGFKNTIVCDAVIRLMCAVVLHLPLPTQRLHRMRTKRRIKLMFSKHDFSGMDSHLLFTNAFHLAMSRSTITPSNMSR